MLNILKKIFKKRFKEEEYRYCCKRCKVELCRIRALSIMGNNLCDNCRIDDSD